MADEVTGTLAGGDSRFRVTPHEIEIVGPHEALHRHTMTHDLVAVGRSGSTVRVRDFTGRHFELATQTEDDAVAIEQMLLRSVPAMATPSRSLLKINWSTENTLLVIGVTISIVVLAYLFFTDPGFRDSLGF